MPAAATSADATSAAGTSESERSDGDSDVTEARRYIMRLLSCAPSALAVGGIGLVSAGCCIVVEKKAPARGE